MNRNLKYTTKFFIWGLAHHTHNSQGTSATGFGVRLLQPIPCYGIDLFDNQSVGWLTLVYLSYRAKLISCLARCILKRSS